MTKDKATADSEINAMMSYSADAKSWSCSWCEYAHSRKEVVYKHIDSKHYTSRYNCDYCDKTCPTQHAMSEHMRAYHKYSA